MDKRQDKTAASTQAETSGSLGQDRYCAKGQEEARRNGVETETNKNKSTSCDVAGTCDDVCCFSKTVLELNWCCAMCISRALI